MNKLAVITGATSGIGYEFSKIFAKNNFNLLLTGRNETILKKMQIEFTCRYNIQVFIFVCDLSIKQSVKDIYEFIKNNNLQVDILVNNAGIGYNGLFENITWEKEEEIISLNIIALTYLTKLLLNDMKKVGKGKILNVASTGAYQPGPLINVYYATKAYVLSFSQALREEVKELNITVTTLCPGATKTNFSKRAGKGDLKVAMSAEFVARKGFTALMKNKAVCIPGFINKILVVISKILPSNLNAKAVKIIQKKAICNK
ncbi:SDR family NAD(P)-dependent oxidoreductase [Clostridium tarantellae]|uniref:SDR family NAD(P)-dependent oxidoreductase n=1 Tax=Clostridium tarantellae TaxID=39493 RepID=A0A6I1MVV0_9CLOT|nr:SDR family oxidoreductase [Clostridium tarantellae]MPQ44299.1 SDR family NAD(P)-dependent oxidoreductase [Clostridium tarantellae]